MSVVCVLLMIGGRIRVKAWGSFRPQTGTQKSPLPEEGSGRIIQTEFSASGTVHEQPLTPRAMDALTGAFALFRVGNE